MVLKPRNADYTKEYNRKNVMRILRRTAMSRAELARATGLTRAATSLIVEELLSGGVLSELEAQSVGRGRSATPLTLRSDSFYALAVDLSRKGCSVGLCDMAGNLLQYKAIPNVDNMIAAICDQLSRVLKTVDPKKVLGIGISSPGPIDKAEGKILNPPQFEEWHGVEIQSILSEALGLPAYLEHDVCALALHQLERGESQNFMLVFVDIGIGASVMANGKLMGQAQHFSGELGHTSIRFDGRQCECGNRGCLEAYASIPKLLEGSRFSSWSELMDNVAVDPEARKLLDQEAVYLSAGVINLLNLIPVDTIYLSGEVCYRYELLAKRLLQEIRTKSLSREKQEIQIFPSSQHPQVGVLAAADVVFSEFLTV